MQCLSEELVSASFTVTPGVTMEPRSSRLTLRKSRTWPRGLRVGDSGWRSWRSTRGEEDFGWRSWRSTRGEEDSAGRTDRKDVRGKTRRGPKHG